jgi:hypothetical protein
MGPLVDGVDHVYVPMTDASAAFAVLTEHLRLPVLWPFTSFGSFSSGGVSVGSIKLEIIDANPEIPWSRAHHPPRIQGIAFRPSGPVDDAYLADVEARRIPHSAPAQFEREGRPAWTNVYFPDFVSDTAGAFVCDYHSPEPKDIARRQRVLADCGGGRLGVLDAVELVIITRDITAARQRWQRLFDPLDSVPPLTWRPSVGPAITVTEGDEERVGDLLLAVRSPQEAHHVWRAAAAPGLGQFPLRLTATHPSTRL